MRTLKVQVGAASGGVVDVPQTVKVVKLRLRRIVSIDSRCLLEC